MASYQELVAQVDAARRRIEATERTRIAVCVDTSSIAAGALETLQALRDAVASGGLDVSVDEVGGNGMSFANPVVLAARPDGASVVYQHLTADKVRAFVDAVVGRNEAGAEWALGVLDGDVGGLPKLADEPWFSIQSRRIMADMGITDPESIDDAIARGAYAGLEKALGLGQEAIVEEVRNSRLRGRSGSDFSTGQKWHFLRTSPTSPKTMVCNADEGDPGAWVNRMTLENDPHALIEGMIIGAWATGAIRGYIYVRGEYPLAARRVDLAIEQARAKGILGDNVLGRDFSFDLKLIVGAGSYVCGEESGLIASVEDARGMPKIRPPFPAASGVFGQGSNVNNVETYHSVAWLFRNSLEAYLQPDTGRNAGTMMFTLSGKVQRVGCFELPMGTPMRDLYEVCGGGAPAGHEFKALQAGGPLIGVMPALALDLGLEPENFKEFRDKGIAAMGGGGVVFIDDTDCIVNLCRAFEHFLEDESCGRCTSCHGGTQRMVEILRRIQRGVGRESDVDKMRLLASTLVYSNCIHGQASPSVIVSTLAWFMDDLEEHIYDRRCRAQVCKGLIRYEIAAQDPALARAADYCPTSAILRVPQDEGGIVDGGYVIDDALCVRCNACKEIAPDAVRIVDKFGPEARITRGGGPLDVTNEAVLVSRTGPMG